MNNEDIRVLSTMYEGDKIRDASSTVRGFLYQDYIAIDNLLEDQVECVALEYLEDVDVLYKNNDIKMIQAKYYPCSEIKTKEVFTDLYFQFLKGQILGIKLQIKPSLFYYSSKTICLPNVERMKEFLETDSIPNNVNYPQNPRDWITTNINSLHTKKDQKNKLFSKYASMKTIKDFVSSCNICLQKEIGQYVEEIKNKLGNKFFPTSCSADQKTILLGLSTLFIQKRYISNETDFKTICFEKSSFDSYINSTKSLMSEEKIASYLIGRANECYFRTIRENNLSEERETAISKIYSNSVQWIKTIGSSINTQYQLLNTVSRDTYNVVNNYLTLSINDRLLKIAEVRDNFDWFLRYLWKIILDIYTDNPEERFLNPAFFVNPNIHDYICFSFPKDRTCRNAIILPNDNGEFVHNQRAIMERMMHLPDDTTKPDKWYFKTFRKIGGDFYAYSVADNTSYETVTNVTKKDFYVECMDCIKIQENEWNINDDCCNCIFATKCKKGGEKI